MCRSSPPPPPPPHELHTYNAGGRRGIISSISVPTNLRCSPADDGAGCADLQRPGNVNPFVAVELLIYFVPETFITRSTLKL